MPDQFLSQPGAAPTPWFFDVVTYGAKIDNTTDDTAAVQATINAAYAYADAHPEGFAEIGSSAAGISLIAGPLITAGGYNAQLSLPDRAVTAPKVLLRFSGAPAHAGNTGLLFVSGETVKQTTGWVLRSSLTGKTYDATHGLPCVIGGPDYEKTVVPRSWVFSNLRIEGTLNIRLPDNPSVAAVNLGGVAECDLDVVQVDTDVIQGTDFTGGTTTHNISAPSHPTGVGVVFPQASCNAWSKAGRVTVLGTSCAVVGSEHTDIEALHAYGNLTVLGVTAKLTHLLRVRGGNCEWNTHIVAGYTYTGGPGSLPASNGGPVNITLDVEDLTTAADWRDVADHVLDVNNQLTGVFACAIRLHNVDAARESPILVGGAGLTVMSYALSGWTSLTLLNGWVDFGGGYAPAAYRKMIDGTVVLRGMLKSGTNPGSQATPMFILPAGYRPAYQLIFATISSGTTAGAIEVQAAGAVWSDAATNASIGLDGIRFLAEQ